MITPLNAINRTENFGYTVQKSPLNDISANNMPNGLLRVPHIDNSKNMSNYNVNEYLEEENFVDMPHGFT